MSIIDKLKASVETSTGLPFVYGAQGDINRALDVTDMPCVFAYLADQSAVTDENGIIRERMTMLLFFCDLTQFDFESLENERILDNCKKRAFKWLASMRIPDTLRLVSVNGTSRVYEEFDAIVTAFAVNVTFDEVDGISRCDLP